MHYVQVLRDKMDLVYPVIENLAFLLKAASIPRSKKPKGKMCQRERGTQAITYDISLSFWLRVPYSSRLELLE